MHTKEYRESLLPPLWVVVAFVAVLSIWLISELREIVALLVVSSSVAYLIEPLLKILRRYKISRPVGFFVIASFSIIVLSVLFFTVFPVLQREFLQLVDNFPHYLETAKQNVMPLVHKFNNLFKTNIQPDSETLAKLVQEFMPRVLSGLKGTLLQGYSITLAIVNIALLPFMIFYISMNLTSYRSVFLNIFPEHTRKKVNDILGEIDFFVSGFVRGQLIVSFIMFILYAAGLGFLGVELWFLLAVIAGFGNLVPYLGTITGIILASIMTLITFGSWHHLLITWGIFALVQFIEGTFITPKVLGNNTGLSPLVVILAILVGGSLFGFLGIFLAVPGAAIFKVISRHFHGWVLSKV